MYIASQISNYFSSPLKPHDKDPLLGLETIENLQSGEVYSSDPRFRIAWLITTTPFRVILEIFIRCIGAISGCLGGKKIETVCKVFAYQLAADVKEIFNYFQYGETLLVPARNIHQILPPIYLEDGDPDCSKPDRNLSFYQDKGLCFGGSLWFAYLIHMTWEVAYPDRRSQLIAIAQQFSSGVPFEGAFFQKLSTKESDEQLPFFKSPPVAQVPFEERSHLAATKNAIDTLQENLYGVKLYFHSSGGHYLLVLKESDNDLYVMDLNVGLLHFQGNSISEQFHDYLKKYEPYIESENFPQNFLKFIPMYTQRD